VIDLATRAVEIIGTTPNPTALFMSQAARLLTDPVEGFLRGKRFLILDRDSIFSKAFRDELRSNGVRAVRTPASAPNCNAFAERFVLTVRREVTDRMIFFGADSLRRALGEHRRHYNAERNHQGVGNELIAPVDAVGVSVGRVERRKRLGGMLNFYYRRPA